MAERKTKIPWMGKIMDGMEVPIEQSTERWSELVLEDGTIIRVKQSVASVVRIDGSFDAEGNPMYVIKSAPSVAIVQVNENLRKPTHGN